MVHVHNEQGMTKGTHIVKRSQEYPNMIAALCNRRHRKRGIHKTTEHRKRNIDLRLLVNHTMNSLQAINSPDTARPEQPQLLPVRTREL